MSAPDPTPKSEPDEFEETLQENMALSYAMGLEGSGITTTKYALLEKHILAAHQKDVEAAQSVAYMEGVGKLDETVRAAVVAALEQLINLPGANHDDIYYAGVKRLAEIEKELAE